MTSNRYRRSSATVRLGLLLGVAAAAVAAAAPSGDLLEGTARKAAEGTFVFELEPTVAGIGIAGIVLIGAAAALPWLWAHLAGIVVTWGMAATCGFYVARARQSEDFAEGADLTLLGGGQLLMLAFLIGLVAVVVALVGIRRVALSPREPGEAPAEDARAAEAAPEPPPPGPGGQPPRARLSTPALVLGIVGFIVWVVAPLAIALGALGLGEIRDAGGRLSGSGAATAGMVLGIVAMSLAVVLAGLGALAAEPPG